ncbi:MAG: type IA DNA topoisomerase [Lachnospiraceae bacterium]|nr:type IA DNA topoisomerase [Lachnospiraceae bacterium]
MGKYLYIAEKPSVAAEFAKALHSNFTKRDGYMESSDAVVTWCVGHLVTMTYPEGYDPELKRWTFNTLPFIPTEFKYEIIPGVAKQFNIVKGLLNRNDVERIYVCTDSGREGEYIYRLVDMMAGVPAGRDKRRVWIDSQTEEEILRGIREAKPLSAYDDLSDAAYLRAKEDYLMGINFSRVLTLKYGNGISSGEKRSAISVGRVMTCVLGMVVRREREIRDFVKTPFYRVIATLDIGGIPVDAEFKAVEGSRYFGSTRLYKDNGFLEEKDAQELIDSVNGQKATIASLEKKKEIKKPPLLFNLAELQNECSRLFKISPDETLKITQELYEKKLVTYPRTDARVLSTAVAKEIVKNISGLKNVSNFAPYVQKILEEGSYKGIARTRYVNDKQITDHYAIVPTGQGLSALAALKPLSGRVYELISRRFLAIFYPPATYRKISMGTLIKPAEQEEQSGSEKSAQNDLYKGEWFGVSLKALEDEGFLTVYPFAAGKKSPDTKGKKPEKQDEEKGEDDNASDDRNAEEQDTEVGVGNIEVLSSLKKGNVLDVKDLKIKPGETSPPKRYNSGSMILAMENAGQLIEDEDLRAQIKSSGIGTSATRAEILGKLFKIQYMNLNKKTQIITPTKLGELVYEVVNASVRPLLNPELTASWEKGLQKVAEGEITQEEYMVKLKDFVQKRTDAVKASGPIPQLNHNLRVIESIYGK